MLRSIGVLATDHIAVGLVEEHHVAGLVLVYPERGDDQGALQGMPAEDIGKCIREQIERVGKGHEIQVVGVGFPGITRNGIIEESPNLQQVKGLNLQAILSSASLKNGVSVPVRIFNDADVMAADIAATWLGAIHPTLQSGSPSNPIFDQQDFIPGFIVNDFVHHLPGH